MPSNFAGKKEGLLKELLLVIFTKVQMRCGGAIESEDVRGGFEFGDSDEAGIGVALLYSSLDPIGDAANILNELPGTLRVDVHLWLVLFGHSGDACRTSCLVGSPDVLVTSL